MKTVHTIEQLCSDVQNPVVTIGNFDGVHRGHQQILLEARGFAQKQNAPLVAVTFEPHPVAMLYPEKAPGMLTPLPMKSMLLTKNGVDVLLVLQNCREVLELSPNDFVERFLVPLHSTMVVEGSDFNFGKDRSGTIDTLRQLGDKFSFGVTMVPPRLVTLSTGQLIRAASTMIRYMLESGHVADAHVILGRPYRLYGPVIPGHGRGRQLGFPTLNMDIPSQVIPAQGVYAGFVNLADSADAIIASPATRPAVFSIGQTRTFGDDNPLLIETHLIEQTTGPIEGKFMAMDFVEHIRTQHKFKTEQDLIAQIGKDCQKAKTILRKPKSS